MMKPLNEQPLLDIGRLILRVPLGLGITWLHGYPKIFGGRMEGFTQGVSEMGFPLPALFAWMAALSEFVGGLLVAVGLGTRLSAFLIASTMVVAGFIAQSGKPIGDRELALLYLSSSIGIMLLGAGAYSLDALIAKRKS